MPYQRKGVPILPPMEVVRHFQFTEPVWAPRPPGRHKPTSGMRKAMTRTINPNKKVKPAKPAKPKKQAKPVEPGGRTQGQHLTPAQRQDILDRIVLKGERNKDLAIEYGVSPATISCIRHGKTSIKGLKGRPRKAFKDASIGGIGHLQLDWDD